MSQQFRDFLCRSGTGLIRSTKRRNTYHTMFNYGVCIPVELRCPFISFLAIIGLAKFRPRVRMSIMAAISAYVESQRHLEATLFLVGTILAELYPIREKHAASASFRAPRSQMQKALAGLFFFFALLASYPPLGAEKALFWSPFRGLASVILGQDEEILAAFFSVISSALLVYIASRSPFLQGVSTTPLEKLVGKTSLSLYCVHQALINWVGYRSILLFWSITGSDTNWRFELGIGIAFVFQTTVTVCAADIFWRFVDALCVDFTRWVERMCIVSS
jgi:hypothetical protein